MKNILLALLCLFSFTLAAQVERMPNLTASYNAAQSGGGSGYWQLTGTFSDAAGVYDAAGVQVGDIVFFSDGMYTFFLPVTEVVSAAHPSLTVKVSSAGITQISSIPSGQKAIFHPTSKGYFPFVSGISNADQQVYNEYLMSLLDQGGGSCELVVTQTAHAFPPWTPLVWNGSEYERPANDTIIPDYIVVDSLTANTFKVASCGTYATDLTNGMYWYTNESPGYSLVQDTVKLALFNVIEGQLTLRPLVGFNLGATGSSSLEHEYADLIDQLQPTNGDFTSGTGWTLTTGWSISGGKATDDGNNEDYLSCSVSMPGYTASRTLYVVEMDVTGSGDLYVNVSFNGDYYSGEVNQKGVTWVDEKVRMVIETGGVAPTTFEIANYSGVPITIDNVKIYIVGADGLSNTASTGLFKDPLNIAFATTANKTGSLRIDRNFLVLENSGIRVNNGYSIYKHKSGVFNLNELHAANPGITNEVYIGNSSDRRFFGSVARSGSGGRFEQKSGTSHTNTMAGSLSITDTTTQKSFHVNHFRSVDTSYFTYLGDYEGVSTIIQPDWRTPRMFQEPNNLQRKIFYIGKSRINLPPIEFFKVDFQRATDQVSLYGKYSLPNATPSTTAGKRTALYWDGTGSSATPVFKPGLVYGDGPFSPNTTTGLYTVNLPFSMSSSVYMVLITLVNNDGVGDNVTYQVVAQTASSFTLRFFVAHTNLPPTGVISYSIYYKLEEFQ